MEMMEGFCYFKILRKSKKNLNFVKTRLIIKHSRPFFRTSAESKSLIHFGIKNNSFATVEVRQNDRGDFIISLIFTKLSFLAFSHFVIIRCPQCQFYYM